MSYFKTENMAVGYNGNILIKDINIEIEKGTVLTLIGPNGAGKSTILKSITRQIAKICGTVWIDGNDISKWSVKDMAQNVAVMLTDRIHPEMMNCEDVVAMGRYPYTNMLGKLTPYDREIVCASLERVGAADLAKKDYMTLSDGQKQRILLARAICQEPEVIVLDEPTAYLDVRHKIELLDILREMAREKKITVIMSLHEIDLATKASDYIICIKGDTIDSFGKPEEILKTDSIEKLYDIKNGSYNLSFGSVEMKKPVGKPRVFVVCGDGRGIECFRELQRRQIPFGAGILFENDIDFQVARALGDSVISSPAFEEIDEEKFKMAAELLLTCEAVIDAGTPIAKLNQFNAKLLSLAQEKNIPIYKKDEER